MKYFKLGDKVKVSSENDNEGYDEFRNQILTIVHVAKNRQDHPGYDSGMNGEPLYDLEDEFGENVGSSLYFYELEEA